MEERNLKRKEHRKNITKITDQGDIIKVIEKVGVKQRITTTLLQADRGDTKSKPIVKSIGKETVNNDIKRNKTVSNAIFQSNKGSLQLKKLKTRENFTIDDIKTVNGTKDNAILMDADIKPFLKDKNELRIEKNDSIKIDVKNNDGKKRIDIETKKVLNADERKKIREKYTIRSKANRVVSLEMPNLLQNEESSRKICDEEEHRKLADSKSEGTKTVKDSDNKKSKRRPVITTIRSKNDAKVYKTVTFTDFKAEQRDAKALQIKIPTENLDKRKDKVQPVANDVQKEVDKTTESSHNSSNPFRNGESPPTEVAKWAPNCLNKHTKPYYEAWVDTTLAAITKFSEKDKMFLEKQNLIESFRRMLERPDSPDLVYNHMDEKYLGKIKIRQK
ncbi:unnamed protein product [Colias eurytheme]|nr:unnamed protein product [Colias eurytheme]